MVPKRDDPSENIFVFFPEEEKVGVKMIKDYAKRMREENVMRAIIVIRSSLTLCCNRCWRYSSKSLSSKRFKKRSYW